MIMITCDGEYILLSNTTENISMVEAAIKQVREYKEPIASGWMDNVPLWKTFCETYDWKPLTDFSDNHQPPKPIELIFTI